MTDGHAIAVAVVVAATAVALVAGVRSTWSPCGLSMLATITPLAERGRGHRYGPTAAWFVVGSVLGGASLGGAMALLAAGVHATGLPPAAIGVVAVAAGAAVVLSDAGLGGRWSLPVHRRQVNERWLDQFRPWVYGAGFGWQIGSGLATYVMAGGVYLMVVLGALTGRPLAALGVGVLFGWVRGLAVLLGRRITSPERLRAFHQRFFGAGPAVAAGTVVVESASLVMLASVVGADVATRHPWATVGVAALAFGATAPAVWSAISGRTGVATSCAAGGGEGAGARGTRGGIPMEQASGDTGAAHEIAVAGQSSGRPAVRQAGR